MDKINLSNPKIRQYLAHLGNELQQTIDQPHCYICGIDSGLNQHHVVPRHLGGTHGSTVTLCTVCHQDGVHQLENIDLSGHVISISDFMEMNSNFNDVKSCLKAYYLARVIQTAEKAVQGSSNKVTNFQTVFKAETNRKVEALQSVLKGKPSKERVVLQAIDELYAKYFVE